MTSLKFNVKPEDGWIIPLNAVCLNDEGVLTLGSEPPPSRHKFSYNMLEVHLFLSQGTKDNTYQMWTKVGRLPYSAEDSLLRHKLIEILRASKRLSRVRFVVENNQNILALFEDKVQGVCTLDVLMVEILTFLNEMTPYATLLRAEALEYRQTQK